MILIKIADVRGGQKSPLATSFSWIFIKFTSKRIEVLNSRIQMITNFKYNIKKKKHF